MHICMLVRLYVGIPSKYAIQTQSFFNNQATKCYSNNSNEHLSYNCGDTCLMPSPQINLH